MRIIYLSLIVLLLACNGQSNRKEQAKEISKDILSGKTQNDNSSASDILTEDIAKSIFPNAGSWRTESNEDPYPMCYRYFDDGQGNGGVVGITIVKGRGSKASFEQAMSYLKMKKEKVNIGKLAYYMPQMGQLSVWIEDDIVHAIANKNGKGDKEKAILLIKEIYK